MSPTVFRYRNYRFFFFSKEEARLHVHVSCADGEAKFWLEPMVVLADHQGLSAKQLKELQKIIKERKHEIVQYWRKHFQA